MSTSRTIRRALERKQARNAAKQARQSAAANDLSRNDLSRSALYGSDLSGQEPFRPAAPHHTEVATADECDSVTGEDCSVARVPFESEAQARLRATLFASGKVEQDFAGKRLARREINRLNARYSSGPTSSQGKAVSSMNALKTGLTGRTVLLPDDDAAAYQAHLARFFAEHQPSGDRESEIVQSLADTRWRLNRIPSLEAGIYALGRIQFADLFASHDPATRAALIQAHTHLHFQKQLTNLALQEARLRRHFEKDLAELGRLQAERSRTALSAQTKNSPARVAAAPRANFDAGFEFSAVPHPSFEPRAAESVTARAGDNSLIKE